MRIAILGYSGSGKSTLAKYLSTYYSIPVLYLDTIQFEANWKERNRQEAISMVAEFMSKEDWIIDGNYTSFLQDERLDLADYIIYMAFSRFNCLLRAYKRYFRYKNTSRESMASGCIEKIDIPFVWWILHKGRSKEKKQYYNSVLQKYHTKSIVLNNQKQLNKFMIDLFDSDSSTTKEPVRPF